MKENLISISDKAADRIKNIIAKAAEPIRGVRVSVRAGGCAGMEYEMTYLKEIQKGDKIVNDNGVTVYIDPKAVIYLIGTKMDYKENKFASSFVFNNPNETERCGCGESFKI